MTSISDLVSMMSTDYGSHRQEVLEKISQVDLLILDDLGTENILDVRKSTTIELTYKVIDSRYLSGKPMVISTNLDIISVLNHPDTDVSLRRIFERIMQKCKPFNMGSINRRQAQSHANSQEFNEILAYA
jgi:DNA replication protein DnaC